MSKLRILLADDHTMLREGLKMLVNAQSDMECVGEAGDGRAAFRMAQELQPDVVVMDVSMPELNGLKATEKLKSACPHIKVLTLTRHKDDGYLQQLLGAGVSGYVLKQSAASNLIDALRVVAAGGNYLDPAIAGKVFAGYAVEKTKLRGETIGRQLTARESEVLRHIALGYSNKEIADKLDISVKTAEAHKANCLKKLNIKSRKEIISYAMLQGWMREN